jgi:penicillin-binding protein 1A
MTYAHQGIELKPIPYVEPEKPAVAVAEAKDKGAEDPDEAAALAAVPHPSNLSVATTQWLNALQSLMENAAPVKPMADLKPSAPVTMVAGEAEPAAAASADAAPR